MLLAKNIVRIVSEEAVESNGKVDDFITIANKDNYLLRSYSSSSHFEENEPVSGFGDSIKFALKKAISLLFSFDDSEREFCIEDFMAKFEGEYFEFDPEDQGDGIIYFYIFYKTIEIPIAIYLDAYKEKIDGCLFHTFYTEELGENLILLVYTTGDGSVAILVDYSQEENEVTITSSYLIFHDL